MQKLIKGLARFRQEGYAQRRALFQSLAEGQKPEALFITCSDSRIDPNLITQTNPGDLFICRNAGNIVPPHSMATGGTTASIEYAVMVLEVSDIIVCGHTDCGAMNAAMNPQTLLTLPHVSNWLSYSGAALARVKARHADDWPSRVIEMTKENVVMQLKHLETHPSVAAKLAVGSLRLHGWLYDIPKGEMLCYDPREDDFQPFETRYADHLRTESGV